MICNGDCVRMPRDTWNRLRDGGWKDWEHRHCSATRVIVKTPSAADAEKLLVAAYLFTEGVDQVDIM